MANVVQITIRGKDQVTGTMGKIAKSSVKLAKTTVKLGLAVVGASAAVVGFVAINNRALDSVQKFSQRIPISTEALSAFHVAAERGGVATATFDMALQRATRRVAEAAKGMGEAQGALRELGLDAREIAALPVDEQFLKITDAMSMVTNESEKLRLGFKLFDSEGTAVLQTMKDGSKGFRDAAKDAAFLGLVISSQAAANAAEFGDSMSRATGSITGMSRAISSELTPLLTGLGNTFADSFAGMREDAAKFTRSAITNFVAVGIFINDVLDKVSSTVTKAFESKEAFQAFVNGAKAAFTNLFEIAQNVLPAIVAFTIAAFKVIGSSMTQVFKAAWANIKSVFTGKSGPTLAELIFENIPQATEEARAQMAGAFDNLSIIAEDAGAKIKAGIGDALGVSFADAKDRADALIASMEQFGTVAETQATIAVEAVAGVMERFAELRQAWADQNADVVGMMAQTLQNTMTGAVQAVSDAVADAIITGASLADALRSIAQQVLKSIISMMIKAGIQRTILAGINKAAVTSQGSQEMSQAVAQTYANTFKSTAAIPIIGPGLAPGAAAAASAAVTAGAIAAGAAGAATGLVVAGARADGGPVRGGSTFLVGERGPELFTPSSNGGITPNDRLGGGGGGVVVENLVVHIMENVTDIDQLLSMPKDVAMELVAGPLMDALNTLSDQGIRPNFAERGAA